MIGRKRSRQAWKIASSGAEAAVALGLQREVDHHDGVFLHDADQQHDADQRDQAERRAEQLQRQQRAHARRRQRREDGQRVDVALVQHAQHDIDRGDRRQDQDHLRVQRLLEHLRGAGEGAAHRRRHAELGHRAVDGVAGLAQAVPNRRAG